MSPHQAVSISRTPTPKLRRMRSMAFVSAFEIGPHVVCHGKADDTATLEVDHRRQVKPALPGAHVGDVAAPGGVDLAHPDTEVATNEVDGLRLGVRIGDGGLLEAALAASHEPVKSHEASDALFPHTDAVVSQLVGDAGCPISAPGLAVDLFDPLGELAI